MARILVIDDEELVRRTVARMLATGGHQVREAHDGTSGLGLWHHESVDLVITDIAMPDMTGFELISALRAEGASVPIVAISGSVVVSDLEVIERAKALGGVQLLTKPFSREQLTAAVASALVSPPA
jgi:CheY-like chemotaxis protein